MGISFPELFLVPPKNLFIRQNVRNTQYFSTRNSRFPVAGAKRSRNICLRGTGRNWFIDMSKHRSKRETKKQRFAHRSFFVSRGGPIDWFSIIILISAAFIIGSIVMEGIDQFAREVEIEYQDASADIIYLQKFNTIKGER